MYWGAIFTLGQLEILFDIFLMILMIISIYGRYLIFVADALKNWMMWRHYRLNKKIDRKKAHFSEKIVHWGGKCVYKLNVQKNWIPSLVCGEKWPIWGCHLIRGLYLCVCVWKVCQDQNWFWLPLSKTKTIWRKKNCAPKLKDPNMMGF